jgi:hypothetical protein
LPAQQCSWKELPTTPLRTDKKSKFSVTHQFHPLSGKQFELVDYRECVWNEQRVYYINDEGLLSSIPATWTDVVDTEPFVAISAGRSYFRTQDLLEMVSLIRRLSD